MSSDAEVIAELDEKDGAEQRYELQPQVCLERSIDV
jgi:hypothetical protein